MPAIRDLDDPLFPHGRNSGYVAGCRAGSPCPATPTCAEAHNADMARYRKRAKYAPTAKRDGRITDNVIRRLNETLKHATAEQVADLTGMSATRIEDLRTRRDRAARGVRIKERYAAPLDAAWALIVHGSDVTKIEKHGKQAYADNYCRCQPCTHATSRDKKRWQTASNYGAVQSSIDPTLTTHTRTLVDAAGSIGQLSKVIDMSHDAISRVLEHPERPVRFTIQDRLRAWTPAKVDQHRTDKTRVSPERAMLLNGQLRALGYPSWWQNREAGLCETHYFTRSTTTFLWVERAMEELAARIGDTPADPARDGIKPASIARAKIDARKMGCYPPIYYNDDGTLDWRSLPEHPWTRRSERAHGYLHLAWRLVQPGVTQAKAGTDSKQGERMAKQLGLTYVPALGIRTKTRPEGTKTKGGTVILDRMRHADLIRRINDAHAAVEAGEVGPVYACLTLGLMEPTDPKHPEVAAWLHDQEEADDDQEAAA